MCALLYVCTWPRYLQMSLKVVEVRKQDTLKIIRSISLTTIGRSLAWDFFRAKWDILRAE